jgi:CelD/BcsL family acetyltransferase involved in cellulose biosynthesis
LTELVAPAALPLHASVTLEAVTTLEGIDALQPSYERLLDISANTLPFALHEWHATWCRHFLNCNPRVHDEPLFCVLRDASGTCVAVVPLVVSRRWVGPLRIVSVNLLGADPAVTEVRAPLVQPGYESLTARAVQDRLMKIGHWDWVHWTGISEDFAAALSVRGTLQWQPALSDYVLDLPPSWEEFRATLKRNIRESLRHCYNSLKRDNHRFELKVIEAPGEVRGALERFLDLHVKRSELRHTIIHPNRFESRVSREFLFEACDRLAQRGILRIFQLEIDSRTVAMRVAFEVRDSLYLYYSGFDPAWSKYSVMTTTVAEAIKYAISRGLKTVNLSPTKDVSKMRWGPRQVDYRAAYELNGRLRSRLARSAYMKARSGEGLQSWVLQHLIQARRQWL